jgi:hypothetical protein
MPIAKHTNSTKMKNTRIGENVGQREFAHGISMADISQKNSTSLNHHTLDEAANSSFPIRQNRCALSRATKSFPLTPNWQRKIVKYVLEMIYSPIGNCRFYFSLLGFQVQR